MKFTRDNEFLFAERRLSDTLNGWLASIEEEVARIPAEQFRILSDQELIAHVRPLIEFQPLELHKEQWSRENTEEVRVHVADGGLRLEVPGFRFTITIPYTGKWPLWKLGPSSSRSVLPQGKVQARDDDGGELRLIVEGSSNDSEDELKRLITQNLEGIDFFLQSQRRDIEKYNERIDESIRRAVRDRRERLQAQERLVSMLEIPLKTRTGQPDFSEIPLKRKLVRPLPQEPTSSVRPEWTIRNDDYEHILGVIRHAGRSFEASPKTYIVHDEESLRDIVLSHLNGHYGGRATGETFRKTGKTDIRIEADNRAAFVGECKVWKGPSTLSEGISQLLAYLTWRDCKTALVIFNRKRARFSDILRRVPVGVMKNELFLNELSDHSEDGEWRFQFRASDDPERLIATHIFLFNLYTKNSGTH